MPTSLSSAHLKATVAAFFTFLFLIFVFNQLSRLTVPLKATLGSLSDTPSPSGQSTTHGRYDASGNKNVYASVQNETLGFEKVLIVNLNE